MCTSSLILLAALDLGTLFSNKEAWTGKPETFAVSHAKDGFVFASEARDIVNCLKHNTCTWYGLAVWEAKVFFDRTSAENGVSRVELSLFNRGDAGAPMDKAGLDQMLEEVTRRFDPAGRKDKPERTVLRQGGFQYRLAFPRTDPGGELLWGVAKDGAVEYVRLTLAPKGEIGARKGGLARRAGGLAAKKRIRDNVTKGANGDIFIDNVPMVDQGQKGYCAAAVTERVLRYYGNMVDEHEIAQQAGTSSRGGTDTATLRRVVTDLGAHYALGSQEIVTLFGGNSESELQKYNRAAKNAGKPELSLQSFIRGNVVYLSEMREAMDKDVVYAMRQKDPRMKKFLSGVRQQVNAGVPVFWGVTLGIFPERGVNLQSIGGHMRLIIGYNDKKHEVLYTDTWGEGHELKRMPEDWAFTITNDAFFLKPR